MNNIFSTTLRLNLDREDDKKALHYLKNADGFSSYSRAVVAAVNDYFDRKEKTAADPYLETREKEDAFLQKVQQTIEASLASAAPGFQLAALAQLAQGMQFSEQRGNPPEDNPENDRAALEFLENF